MSDGAYFDESSGYRILAGKRDRCDSRGVVSGATIWRGYGIYFL